MTLAGSEWAVRMAALHGAAELTHPQELIQHILFDAADGRPARLLATLGFEADRESLLEAITGAESRLGYRFSCVITSYSIHYTKLYEPHARPENGVLATGYALVTLKRGVEFGDAENDPIDVLVFMAAKDSYNFV